jgi:UDP-GlcNAc:undecaprenyl-phosphate/decaprenyl-phosphate GlcNAc-1-phosphate transferase
MRAVFALMTKGYFVDHFPLSHRPIGLDIRSMSFYAYLVCFGLGFIIAWQLTPAIIRLALKLGAVDRPVNRKIHSRAMPRLGGIALFLGMWTPLAVLLAIDNDVTRNVIAAGWKLRLIFLGGLGMLVVGAVDDIRGLSARLKFALQLPLAIALVYAGVCFDKINVPFLGQIQLGWFGFVISVLWIVGVTNALNLIDGIDGLASGVAYLIAVSLAILSLYQGNPFLAVTMCSLAGACLGFLQCNFSPAKIFLGDSGSLFLGTTLAVSATFGSVKEQLGSSLLFSVALLGYPIADTLLSMARRALRGKPVFAGDASHIHHRLLRRGLDHSRVCLTLYLVCVTFCLWSFAIAQQDRPLILLGTVLVCVLAAASFYYLGYFNVLRSAGVSRERNEFRSVFHFSEMIKAKMGLADTREAVVDLLKATVVEFGNSGLRIQMPANSLGMRLKYEWPRENEPFTSLGKDNLRLDRYLFSDTGLEVEASIPVDPSQEELIMEKRRVFGDVCEAANHRILELMRALEHAETQQRQISPKHVPQRLSGDASRGS